MDKNQSRLRRARKTRAKIAELKVVRLSVHRTNSHMYAQIIDATGGNVLASANTLEAGLRTEVKNGGSVAGAAAVGNLIVQGLRTTAALKRWLMLLAKPASPSN